MYDQPRYEPYEASELFDDGAASRTPVAGTVARGALRADELLHTGRVQVALGRPAHGEPSLREACEKLRRLCQEDPQDPFVPEYAATRLLASGYLAEALLRPLVLAAEGRTPDKQNLLYHSWLIVLRCGAVAVLHHHDFSSDLKTLYFPRAAVRELDPERRWRAVVQGLVREHTGIAQAGFVPPSPDHCFPVQPSGVPREVRLAVTFYSLRQ